MKIWVRASFDPLKINIFPWVGEDSLEADIVGTEVKRVVVDKSLLVGKKAKLSVLVKQLDRYRLAQSVGRLGEGLGGAGARGEGGLGRLT